MARQVYLVTKSSNEDEHVMVVTTTRELAIAAIKEDAEFEMTEWADQNNLWTIYDRVDNWLYWYTIDQMELIEG